MALAGFLSECIEAAGVADVEGNPKCISMEFV